ncbi:hypothetical protein Tco_0791504 [Tanacetum coccineum]
MSYIFYVHISMYKLEWAPIVMENPNHLNEPNEDIPEENPVIPEPNHIEDAHDPNEMVDIPDDEELVDYDGDNEEEPKEEPEEELEPNNGHRNQFAQHPNPTARMRMLRLRSMTKLSICPIDGGGGTKPQQPESKY